MPVITTTVFADLLVRADEESSSSTRTSTTASAKTKTDTATDTDTDTDADVGTSTTKKAVVAVETSSPAGQTTSNSGPTAGAVEDGTKAYNQCQAAGPGSTECEQVVGKYWDEHPGPFAGIGEQPPRCM
jgi:hypothetical protein